MQLHLRSKVLEYEFSFFFQPKSQVLLRLLLRRSCKYRSELKQQYLLHPSGMAALFVAPLQIIDTMCFDIEYLKRIFARFSLV